MLQGFLAQVTDLLHRRISLQERVVDASGQGVGITQGGGANDVCGLSTKGAGDRSEGVGQEVSVHVTHDRRAALLQGS